MPYSGCTFDCCRCHIRRTRLRGDCPGDILTNVFPLVVTILLSPSWLCKLFFSFFFFILRRMGKNKTLTTFPRASVSIELNCVALAGVSFSSRGSDRASDYLDPT